MAGIVHRKMGPSGSTGSIALWGEGSGATFEHEYSNNGETLEFHPVHISKVTNMSGANATVNGKTYGPGQWDLWETPIPAAGMTAGGVTGNVVVLLQGVWKVKP
ncbi:MAG: hypothetical protein N0C84_01180 [Candidatus Thiodiazotropha taylori]|uniref:Uncharacterized protein n=1 Tax=Candidatus Thiodiazotropha taylori TaxID=2792791 RepID=A0A9E4K9H1_9GAMM|nr:hypothetical protein [Candidatus Thiodiazotropha taylori]MCW4255059.1 hypothetical protein [Candidatus Thiodiazotropha taylori]